MPSKRALPAVSAPAEAATQTRAPAPRALVPAAEGRAGVITEGWQDLTTWGSERSTLSWKLFNRKLTPPLSDAAQRAGLAGRQRSGRAGVAMQALLAS